MIRYSLFFTFLFVTVVSKAQQWQKKEKVTFYADEKARISYGLTIPAGKKLYLISGIVPSENDTSKKGTERYGDTKIQAINVLEKIQKQLKTEGLTLKDVVYLRAYVGPDPSKANTFDFKGWNEAYDQFFNNPGNPVKVGRATIGANLVSPDYLIELEGIAVYP